ncbi:MAG TPA: hypothetical protein VK886_03720 [Vicinamibacterales bacterium]|nr:hypothetical protein [Vicinamibacterales bacterium]
MRSVNRVTVVSVIVGIVVVGFLAVAVAARQAGDAAPPWTAGRCYRATVLEPSQQHTLQVLEDPVGAWVRVRSDPRLPRVPGSTPGARVWLNTMSVFSVQEVECASFPHER